MSDSLSDKIFDDGDMLSSDVKEAVKELKFEFVVNHEDKPEEIVRKFSKLVDKIFGEKLTDKTGRKKCQT